MTKHNLQVKYQSKGAVDEKKQENKKDSKEEK